MGGIWKSVERLECYKPRLMGNSGGSTDQDADRDEESKDCVHFWELD